MKSSLAIGLLLIIVTFVLSVLPPRKGFSASPPSGTVICVGFDTAGMSPENRFIVDSFARKQCEQSRRADTLLNASKELVCEKYGNILP